MIAAADIAAHLLKVVSKAPEHEAQVRPLIGLTNEQAAAAWLKATKAARGRPVTARLVRAAVAEITRSAPAAAKAKAEPLAKAKSNVAVEQKIYRLITSATYFLHQLEQGQEIQQNADNVRQLLGKIKDEVGKMAG